MSVSVCQIVQERQNDPLGKSDVPAKKAAPAEDDADNSATAEADVEDVEDEQSDNDDNNDDNNGDEDDSDQDDKDEDTALPQPEDNVQGGQASAESSCPW